MSRAAYMRDYRAKRKAANVQAERPGDTGPSIEEVRALARELVAAQTEIAHLKRELAARASGVPIRVIQPATATQEPRWVPEFRPVPKPGQKK